MSTNSNLFKRAFAANEHRFTGLTDQEAELIKRGIGLVKMNAAKKYAHDKRNFADFIDGVETNGYMEENNKVVNALTKYCMKAAGFNVENFNIEIVKSPNIHNNRTFKEKFGMILSHIITPVNPALTSAQYMSWADIVQTGYGDTAEFKIKNNDLFYVYKQATGILRGSNQRQYPDSVVILPEAYNIESTVDWYQVAAGYWDLGDTLYKIGQSFSAYITQMVVGAMTSGAADNLPVAYTTTGFTTAKFIKMAELVSAANGGAPVRVYGTLAALAAVLPDIATKPELVEGLGREWAGAGYLANFMGVDLIRIPQILIPNTVNSDPVLGLPDDVLFFMAGTAGENPVKIVFEGDDIQIDVDAFKAPDMQMGFSVTQRMGIGFIAGGKFGVMSGVSL